MARTINKVELLGRVGTDPEMQYTPGGTAVTKLRLATDRYRKDAENDTDWHNVVVWGGDCGSGEPVRREGPARLRRGPPRPELVESDDGQRRHRTEVHASEVVFLDSKNGTGNGDDGPEADASPFA